MCGTSVGSTIAALQGLVINTCYFPFGINNLRSRIDKSDGSRGLFDGIDAVL